MSCSTFLRKTQAGKSPDHRGYIAIKKLCFQNVFVHTKTKSQRFQNNCSTIRWVWRAFFKSSFFRGGLVWTVGVIVEIKLLLQICLQCSSSAAYHILSLWISTLSNRFTHKFFVQVNQNWSASKQYSDVIVVSFFFNGYRAVEYVGGLGEEFFRLPNIPCAHHIDRYSIEQFPNS